MDAILFIESKDIDGNVMQKVEWYIHNVIDTGKFYKGNWGTRISFWRPNAPIDTNVMYTPLDDHGYRPRSVSFSKRDITMVTKVK